MSPPEASITFRRMAHSTGASCGLNETPCTDTISYAALDFTVDGMYLTQSTQTYTGTVPIVKDREGALRIFVKANRDTHAIPIVRVQWYSSGALVRTDRLTGPTDGLPVAETVARIDANGFHRVAHAHPVQPSVLVDIIRTGDSPAKGLAPNAIVHAERDCRGSWTSAGRVSST